MIRELRILLLEDNPADADLIKHELWKANIKFSLKQVETKEAFLKELKDFTPGLILSDNSLPSFDGISALTMAKEKCPDVPFIFVSGTLGEERAIITLKSGATDYILKERLSRLGPVVRRSLNEADERKAYRQTEEALQDTRAILDGIFDSAMDAIISVDTEQRILLFNKAAERMFRCSVIDAIGQPIDRFIPELISFASREHKQGLGRTWVVDPIIGEQRLLSGIRSDGEEFPIEASISRVKAFEQYIYTFILRDVTARKRAEEKIREQAELLDKTQDAIIVQDLNDRIIYWSEGAERLYGWTTEEVIGKSVNELLNKEDSGQIIRVENDILERGEFSKELRQVTKNGDEITVESRWTVVYDDNQRPKSILVINTDITEKKELEAQLVRAQRMESIGTLAGGIAHDLNNVLQPIMMVLQILCQKFDDEKSLKLLDTLEKLVQRGADLVKQILSIARGFTVERTFIQLGDIISEIKKILEETFPKSIQIKTDIPKRLWTISGDPTEIHQVIMNLCVNARDAMPNGGKLNVFVENIFIDENYARMIVNAKVGPFVVVNVSDTGIGIPPDNIDRIFDPFFTTKEYTKGTGLGLSIAYRIIKNHGGFVNVYSKVGKGTWFKVYLPAVRSNDVLKADEDRIHAPSGNGELILVVDDEASICEIIKMTLETYNYNVITARDGVEAIALFTRNRDKVKAIIVDSVMPIMDGLTTIKELRKIDPSVKIISASGFDEKDRHKETGATDAQVFLWKPFTAQALLKALHEVLRVAKKA